MNDQATNLFAKAQQELAKQELEKAAKTLTELLAMQPNNTKAWHLAAQISSITKNFPKAIELIKRALLDDPNNLEYQLFLATSLLNANDPQAANTILQQLYQKYPKHAEILLLLGKTALQAHKTETALYILQRYIKSNPQNIDAHNDLGCCYAQLQQLDKARTCFNSALQLQPNHCNSLNNLAVILTKEGNFTTASEKLQQVLTLEPKRADSWCNLGNVYKKQDNLTEAMACYQKALELQPNYIDALNNLSLILIQNKALTEAANLLQQAVALNPQNAQLQHNLGLAHFHAEQFSAAEQCLTIAVSLNSKQWDSYYYLAQIALGSGNLAKAYTNLTIACELQPQNINILLLLARVTKQLDNKSLATKLYSKILKLEPNNIYALCDYAYMATELNDFPLAADLSSKLENNINIPWQNTLPIEPFFAQALSIKLETYHKILQSAAQQQTITTKKFTPNWKNKPTINIGYISPDLGEHSIGLALQEILKHHNNERFKTYCYSLKPHPNNNITKQIAKSTSIFREFETEGAEKISKTIFADDIDILIDLAGYTSSAMPTIFNSHPAKIQAHYLGYMGTLANSNIDYYIGDYILTPSNMQQTFVEQIINLNTSCFAMGNLGIVPKVTRADYNLPMDKFIYCCFAQSYRINQQTIDTWIAILKQTPNSILWLWEENPDADKNLLAHVTATGINPERIVFQPKKLLTSTWYHQLADVWLDTLNISQATPTLLSLWAEVPVVAMQGSETKARAAASILKAGSLAELVVESVTAYINLAVELYCNPEMLAYTKTKLRNSKSNLTIFQPQYLTSNLEQLFVEILDNAEPRTQAKTIG